MSIVHIQIEFVVTGSLVHDGGGKGMLSSFHVKHNFAHVRLNWNFYNIRMAPSYPIG